MIRDHVSGIVQAVRTMQAALEAEGEKYEMTLMTAGFSAEPPTPDGIAIAFHTAVLGHLIAAVQTIAVETAETLNELAPAVTDDAEPGSR